MHSQRADRPSRLRSDVHWGVDAIARRPRTTSVSSASFKQRAGTAGPLHLSPSVAAYLPPANANPTSVFSSASLAATFGWPFLQLHRERIDGALVALGLRRDEAQDESTFFAVASGQVVYPLLLARSTVDCAAAPHAMIKPSGRSSGSAACLYGTRESRARGARWQCPTKAHWAAAPSA